MRIAYGAPISLIRATSLITFHDAAAEPVEDFSGSVQDSTVTHETRGELASYFSRPIELYKYSWNENTALTTRYLSPWKDYFTAPRIAAKLAGFTRLRAQLHIKVLVNGSPFRYGMAMLSYRPLCNLKSTGTESKIRAPYFSGGHIGAEGFGNFPAGNYSGFAASDKSTVMARSQRPHINIYPHKGEAGEMVLPFVHYQDALSFNGVMLSSAGVLGNNEAVSELSEMGSLVLENVVSLRSTASADSTPVTISIFAWASDVEVFGPSSATVQASEFDEAAASKPSAIASTVASAAALLTKIPIIGPFALATQIAANAASGILKIFGWSNPPVISGVHAIINKYAWSNPSPLVSIQDDVLALDPKNEVTIDPRAVGVGPVDELCIAKFCARPTILDTVIWSPSDAQGNVLLSVPVAPAHFRAQWLALTSSPSVPCARVTMPPYTYAANLFQQWRGDMVIELEVICSAFHRGRLAVLWDPVGALPLSSAFTGDTIIDILDLMNGNKMVYKVPFMSAKGMLRTSRSSLLCYSSPRCDYTTWGSNSDTSDLGTFTANNADAYANGTVYVQVLNQLQSGDISSPVEIVVRTYFENMMLMVPSEEPEIFNTATYEYATGSVAGAMCNMAVVQAMQLPDGEQVAGRTSTVPDMLSRLYIGEFVPSFRPLLHRSQYYKSVLATGVSSAGSKALISVPLPVFPIARMGKVDSSNTDITLNPSLHGGTGTSLVMNAANTTPLAYLTSCFTGWRGSLVWRASTDGPHVAHTFLRRGSVSSDVTKISYTIAAGNSDGVYTRARQALMSNGIPGIASGAKEFGGVVGAIFPYYQPFRMLSANQATAARYVAGLSQTGNELLIGNFSALVQTVPSSGTEAARDLDVHLSVAAGTDFNVFGFVNVPDIYTTEL